MMRYEIIPVTAFQQNCTILWNEVTMKGAIIDPGGDLDLIYAFLEKHKINAEKILCTHGHLDHVGAVAELMQECHLTVLGPHKDDQFWIDILPSMSEQFNFPASAVFEPDQWLQHGDRIEAADFNFDVIHCPGHTPGHVVFYQEEYKIAFVGDVLFKGSIGRTDFPRGNHQDLIDSITQRLWPLGKDITFVSGHGAISTFENERKTNPFVSDAVLGCG